MPHLVATTLAGAAMAVCLPAGAALACPPPGPLNPHPVPVTAVKFTIAHQEPAVSSTRSVFLHCRPTGGSHPLPTQACAQLDRNRGAILQRDDGAVCTDEYAPVVAAAVGHWRGRLIRFKRTFSNSCVMKSGTGVLFEF